MKKKCRTYTNSEIHAHSCIARLAMVSVLTTTIERTVNHLIGCEETRQNFEAWLMCNDLVTMERPTNKLKFSYQADS